MNRALLAAQLEIDEGARRHPYKDTKGKLTIGIGRNLEDAGISPEEARMLLANDLDWVEVDLDRNLDWWRDMSEERQQALANMCFNLGWPRLSTFKKMLSALEAGDYDRAADEALDSKWARQVGARATRISKQIKEG